ncbi:MAG: hypothetical protein HS104_20395 [Polyangiaceae bacterium]|nr:hypothetical protein [Polyangiaceae bacterium]MCE7891995.1 hypothetical protein [Sorangiineae bacterium PRO1]MCL4752624.1 hypothetical protein [Myxococcales bacterium]
MTKPLFVTLLLLLSCAGRTDQGSATGGTAGMPGVTGGTAGSSTGGAAGTASGGVAGTGASGGTGGWATGGAACANIEGQFKASLNAAKKCSLDSTSPTCTQSVDTSIAGCGYYAYAEGSNTAEVAELAKLSAEWQTLGCPPTACALGGWGPFAAKCKPQGLGGAPGLCTPD